MAVEVEKALVHPPLWVDSRDLIAATAWNSKANVRICITGRHLSPTGIISHIETHFTPTADRVNYQWLQRTSAGWLLSVAGYADQNEPQRGQTYLRLGIHREGELAALLAMDYLIGRNSVFWPGGQHRPTVGGFGAVRAITGTDPAAGAEISETVPSSAVWRLRSIAAELVTSAAGAARVIYLEIDDGTNTLHRYYNPTTQDTSKTRQHYWTPGNTFFTYASGQGYQYGIAPDIILHPGYRFRTSTVNLDAGDNWGPPYYQIEEWILQ